MKLSSALQGLLLNRLFGWWWADPLAALALVSFLIQEGRGLCMKLAQAEPVAVEKTTVVSKREGNLALGLLIGGPDFQPELLSGMTFP